MKSKLITGDRSEKTITVIVSLEELEEMIRSKLAIEDTFSRWDVKADGSLPVDENLTFTFKFETTSIGVVSEEETSL